MRCELRTKLSRVWLAPLLLSLCCLVQPPGTAAQCMVASTSMGSGTQGGMDYDYLVKYLSSTYQCSLLNSNNVIGCSPSTSVSTSRLSAAAFTSLLNPSCSWTCTCGSVTIDSTDGLPVELMDFAIDSEDVSDPED